MWALLPFLRGRTARAITDGCWKCATRRIRRAWILPYCCAPARAAHGLPKLAASDSIEAYFGANVDLKALVAANQMNVFEFKPIIAGNYDVAYGKVTAKMLFSTPYEAGEKVAVMIGLVNENADGTITVDWNAFEGVGIAADQIEAAGSIQVELDAETVLAIQNGIALLAVVSD